MKHLFLILIGVIITFNGVAQHKKTKTIGFHTIDNVHVIDEKLDSLVNEIKDHYSGDKDFISAFENSHSAWIISRDANIKMKYPRQKEEYGSALPMCISMFYDQLTERRIKFLKEWIDGVEEGNVCHGSVIMK